MKAAGAVFLSLAGILCGMAARAELAGSVKRCGELCRMLELLAFEIGCFRTPIPDFFRKYADTFEAETGLFCRGMQKALSGGESVLHCWMEQTECFPPKEREMLCPLGNILGEYGAEEQVAAVEAVRHRLTALRDEKIRNLREQGRIRMGLCSAVGLMLAVLLL